MKLVTGVGRGVACLVFVAVAAQPSLAGTLGRGVELYNEGKFAEAEVELNGIAGPEASAYLAASRMRQLKFAEAEGPARTAVAALPIHPVAVAALGGCLVGAKKLDEAVAAMTEALKAKNDQAYAYYWRGMAYDRKKDVARAVEDLQTFVRLAPAAPEASAVKQLLAALRG